MKYSKFTTIVDNGEQYVIYNTLYNNALLCTEETIKLLEKSSEPDSFKEIHPSLWERLYEDKFIVPNELDEFKELKDFIVQEDDSSGHYSITINPTMDCNLRCWYCYEEHLANSNISEDIFERIRKLLTRICSAPQTKSLHLSFFGGEPLLEFHRSVQPLIEYARSLCKANDLVLSLSFTTNAVLLTDEIINYLKSTDLDILMQIPFDGNRDIHNRIKKTNDGKGTYDISLTNLKNAISKGIAIVVRCNYTSKSVRSFEELINDIAPLYTQYDKSLIRFSFQKIWQEPENEEMESVVKEFESRIGKLGGDYYKVSLDNGRCYADKLNSFVINYNGDIYQCTAREFIESNKEGRLLEDGTIEHNDRFYARMESRFSNPECMDCVAYPICKICTTKRMEHDNTKCILKNPKADKMDLIRNRIMETYKYILEHKSESTTTGKHL